MILSIIIPVYNVEKYIRTCMDSVFAQNLPSDQYEVIVINDGTKDHSMEIVSSYSHYPNLAIIEQENQGLSAARNTGLLAAKGDYVWFVDSDDSIENNCLKDITSELVSLKSDVFAYKITQVDEQTGNVAIRSHKVGVMPAVVTGADYYIAKAFRSPMQMFIIRRSLLLENNLYFKEGIYHEDLEFAPRLLYHASCLSVVDRAYYRYLLRKTGSITTSFNTKRPQDLLFIYNSLYTFCQRNISEKRLKDQFLKEEFGLILYSIDVLKTCNDMAFIHRFFKTNRPTYRLASWRILGAKSARFYFFSLLILIHPLVALQYYRLKNKK